MRPELVEGQLSQRPTDVQNDLAKKREARCAYYVRGAFDNLRQDSRKH
jgi:hypothetical protein